MVIRLLLAVAVLQSIGHIPRIAIDDLSDLQVFGLAWRWPVDDFLRFNELFLSTTSVYVTPKFREDHIPAA
jgi:hypothetical protein